MALPLLLATVVAGSWAVGLVVADIRCTDAARDVARAVARGESLEQARAIGQRQAPADATIDITHQNDDIHVTVSTAADLGPAFLPDLPAPRVTAQATLQTEPGQHLTPGPTR